MALKNVLAGIVLVLAAVSAYILFERGSEHAAIERVPTRSKTVREVEQIAQRQNSPTTLSQDQSDLLAEQNSEGVIPVTTLKTDSVFVDADLEESLTQEQLRELADLPAVALRLVTVNENELRERIRNVDVSRVIELQLIKSEPIQIAVIESGDYYDGWQSGMAGFVGRIIGQESSRVQLTVGIGESVHGHFRYDDTYIQIGEYGQNGHHLIWSRDPSYKRKRHVGEK